MKSSKESTLFLKQWKDLTEEDLVALYYEKALTKSEIADLYGVTKGQVAYKLKKGGLNKQRKWLGEALCYALGEEKKERINELVFSFDDVQGEWEAGLEYGPIKVTGGEHKGRIGVLEDFDEEDCGYVYWGSMIENRNSVCRVPRRYLSNHITTYDLAQRAEALENLLAQSRINGYKPAIQSKKKVIELYGEYIFVLKQLYKIHAKTNYWQGNGKKKVFISHASQDAEAAIMIATDLKLAKYAVWFDKWDLELGHSIPQEISDGLDSADALIIMLSKAYNSSAFCRDEWQGYYMKYRASGRAIIAIILDDSEAPPILASRKYFRMSEHLGNYDEMMEQLKRALATI